MTKSPCSRWARTRRPVRGSGRGAVQAAACFLGLHAAAAAQLQWTPFLDPKPDGVCLAVFDSARNKLVVTGAHSDRTAAVMPIYEWDGTGWRKVLPGTGPSPRESAAAAFDPVRNVMVVFGGWSQALGETNEQWEWNGSQWQANPVASRPPTRQQHVMATDPVRRRIVLCGGVNRSDTWEWDGTAWSAFSPAVSPGTRACSGLAYAARNGRMVLYGGRFADRSTWEWDGQNWVQRVVPGPASEFAHTMTASPSGGVVLVGGASSFGGLLRDVHEWDGTAWRLAATFQPRALMAAASSPQTAWFLAGTSAPQGAVDMSDFHAWDGTALTSLAPPGPAGVSGAAATLDTARGAPIVFEGAATPTTTWTLAAGAWQRSLGGPGRRVGVGLAYDPAHARALLYGGAVTPASTLFNDTWSFDGTTWTAVPGGGPPPLMGHGLAWHPGLGRVILAGGWVRAPTFPNPLIYNLDTWSFGTTWQQESIRVASGVPFGGDTTLVFDPGSGELMAFVFTRFAGSTTLTVAVLRSQWQDLGVAPKSVSGGASVAWDPLRHRAVLCDAADNPNGTTFDLVGLAWQQRAPSGTYQRRVGAWMVGLPDRGLLLGGGVLLDGQPTTRNHLLSPVDAARFAPYAQGCPGVSGIPSLTATTLPWLGSSWSRVLRGGPSATAAVLLLGVSDTRLANGTPLPFDLGSVGMPGCRLAASLEVVLPSGVQQGQATFAMTVPQDRSLLGAVWFEQGLLVESGANPAGLVVSPAARAEVGER